MSGGIIGWLVGFLDGSTGKYTFRSTTFRSDTFASGHWCGLGVRFASYHNVLEGPSGCRETLTGPSRYREPLEGPSKHLEVLKGD